MSKSVLVYALVFSLALNVATAGTVAVLWFKGQAQASESSSSPKSMKQFIRTDLGLATEQGDKLIGLIDQKRTEVEELRRRMESTRMEIMSLISSETVNPTAVGEKINELDKIHSQMRRVGVGTLVKIAASLEPYARMKFGAYLKERACRCGPLGPGAGRGPFGDVKDER